MIDILVAGDFCPQSRVAKCFELGNFETVLGEVRNKVQDADFSIVNLECPVKINHAVPIKKSGPNLCCSEKGVQALSWAGFNCVTLANNHFLDYGEIGVNSTLEVCNKNHLLSVGGGNSLKEASMTLFKEINGKIIAIINCCEHEYSIATENTPGSNPLNVVQQYYAIKEASKRANLVLIIVHGGIEDYQLPTPRMKELYHFFVDVGADAVINHHQHCYSGYEIYKGKPIFYGLGNFCFDWKGKRHGAWNEGYLLNLFLNDNELSFKLHPYIQCDDSENVRSMSKCESERFNNRLSEINQIILDDNLLQKDFVTFMETTVNSQKYTLSPYLNKYLAALNIRGVIPGGLPTKRLRSLQNKIMCESHRERMLYFLERKLNK